jgi:hypothetical protein
MRYLTLMFVATFLFVYAYLDLAFLDAVRYTLQGIR